MTAGNIATPLRQIHAPLLVAALAVTFGIGLLAGLAVPRTVGQVAEAASNAGVVAASTGSGTSATVATNPQRLAELQAAEIGGGGLTIDQVSPNAGVVAASSGSGTSAAGASQPSAVSASSRPPRSVGVASRSTRWLRTAGVVAASSGSGTSATVATNPQRLAELQAAEIGGGGLRIDANSPSGR